MNSKIDKGRIEFNRENYEKALGYFDSISDSDENYEYVVIFKITCLMELERYDKALFIIDSLLVEDPRNEFLLYEKIRCHIALNERDESFDALKRFEQIMDISNKQVVVDVGHFYMELDDYRSALKYSDMALALDSNFKQALRLKASVSIILDDVKTADECADELWNSTGSEDLSIILIFMLKLYSGRFRDCLKITDQILEETDDERMVKILKILIFNIMSEKLNVNLNLTGDIDISVDEALDLLFDYQEKGIDSGVVKGENYIIM